MCASELNSYLVHVLHVELSCRLQLLHFVCLRDATKANQMDSILKQHLPKDRNTPSAFA